MSFVHRILDNLRDAPEHAFLRECRDGKLLAFSGADVAGRVDAFRSALRRAGLRAGDRCALVGSNSVAWIAADLALLAEGIVVVPLYARSRTEELRAILADAKPSLLLCETADAAKDLAVPGDDDKGPRVRTFEELLGAANEGDAAGDGAAAGEPVSLGADDPVTIIYTSGTSGEPKGVVLNGGNLEHMLGAAAARLDELMAGHVGEERAYHYLPFCFAGSWLLLLLSLSRRNVLTLNTDLQRIVEDLAIVRPHYFQNVPVLLDRVRDGVEAAIRRRGGPAAAIWSRAMRATRARADGEDPRLRDTLALAAARKAIFPKIRRSIGPELRSLICGSAPLARDTQLFFRMIGIDVLQVYGLTETTAICTMDSPGHVTPGRVGRAVPGVEMKVGDGGEILVRGPNVFAGYWNRPDATKTAFADGWFRTGDQGDVDETGNWRILGRVKNLIVPSSGHNVAPEPLEERLTAMVPEAQQVVLIGNGRPHLAAIVTGDVDPGEIENALEELNADLPHYQRIRASIVVTEPFTIESGLVTANGKLRRDAIAERLADRIDTLYRSAEVPA